MMAKQIPKHILSKKWNGASRVYNLHKDLGMDVNLGRKLKAKISLGEDTFAFLSKAIDRGMQDQDFTLLYRDFEKIVK